MKSSTLPKNWRDRKLLPADYYPRVLPDLGPPDAAGWAKARCPLHAGGMVSVQLIGTRGLWRCASCGRGDQVAFEMRRSQLGFAPAVRVLLAMHA